MACRTAVLLVIIAALSTPPAGAQEFSLDGYRSFLQQNVDLSAGELLEVHTAGDFAREAHGPGLANALYADSIDLKYDLTPYERSLVDRHGFMVTERIEATSFGDAFKEIYTSDLPVFVSTDAILHAVHMSYDDILMETEQQVLIPKLDEMLQRLHGELPALAQDYEGIDRLYAPLSDVDVYLTTARRLLSGSETATAFERSLAVVEEMLGFVAEESVVDYPLFAENCRTLDFSQFKPRGHYTREPELERYFQAMIWLGRTELYLSAPNQPGGTSCGPSAADVARQVRMSALLADLAKGPDILPLWQEIDSLIEMFVGQSDNVRFPELYELLEDTGVKDVAELDSAGVADFQDVLATKSYAGQRILSQILFSNPMNPDQIEPASAFMLLGQRFVIDSYVTAEVVYDRVKPLGSAPERLLPSTLDVLFALGNDAAGQLLEDELETYNYAPNLAALRYLIDSYDEAFWDQSMYNGWLHAIRALKAPRDRSSLPPFMQTAAWWQEKMNTQLAAWAQLRHDNLLYVKQSYTGSIGCEFPYSYVEPIPEFYEAISRFASNASVQFRELSGSDGWSTTRMAAYFENLVAVNDTLRGIAFKELAGEGLSGAESDFLRRMLRITMTCGEQLDGWYPSLYYNPDRATKEDLVVADVHTAPTDRSGAMVGWVVHAGTGPLDMAVLTADVSGVGSVAFVGPVMSYYEHVSTGFKRLTDEEWQTAYAEEPSFRPEFVNLYLADADGDAKEASTFNLTMTSSEAPPEVPEQELRLAPNYPNPFRDRTVIAFKVPFSRSNEVVEVAIYNVQGQRVRTLLSKQLPAGAFTVEWDGRLEGGMRAASGTYVCHLSVGAARASQVVTLVR